MKFFFYCVQILSPKLKGFSHFYVIQESPHVFFYKFYGFT